MVDTALLVTVANVAVTIAGICTSTFLFLAPWSSVQKIERTRDIGKMSFFPFLCLWLNCFLWVVYGYMWRDVPLTCINFVGFIVTLRYVLIVYAYSPSKRPLEIAIGVYIFVIFLFFAVFSFELRIRDITPKALGLFASLAVILLYGAPIINIVQAIRFRSVESIPFLNGAASVINGSLWFVYGTITNQPPVAYPNSVGIVIGLFSSVTFFVLVDKKQLREDIRNIFNKKKKKKRAGSGTSSEGTATGVAQADAAAAADISMIEEGGASSVSLSVQPPPHHTTGGGFFGDKSSAYAQLEEDQDVMIKAGED
eukprot:GEZU01015584.1.p1 GENE.GEZU01015584.1~~GEZU01015584.1.p1  ORF type:complete len:311 (+),score=81.79 GEZU01015584.1:98-1030(+)